MVELTYTKKKYSDSEFLRLLQKRIKQSTRGINPNKEIIIEASKRDFELVKAFLERIFKEPKVIKGKSPFKALSFEEEASLALQDIRSGKKPKKINNLMSKITEEEIVHLCRIFKIKNEKPNIHPFLKEILAKHPDVAFGFAQALEEINE